LKILVEVGGGVARQRICSASLAGSLWERLAEKSFIELAVQALAVNVVLAARVIGV